LRISRTETAGALVSDGPTYWADAKEAETRTVASISVVLKEVMLLRTAVDRGRFRHGVERVSV
jgi:hypothetical protein